MENPELIKKISPEIVQTPDTTAEKQTEQNHSALVLEKDKVLERKNQIIEETKSKIDDLRNQLKLPPTADIPHSIQAEQESIDRLNHEKSEHEKDLKIQTLNQESQIENVKKFEGNLRSALESISTSSGEVLNALAERQGEHLMPLQSADEFQGLVTHLKEIKNNDGKFDISGLDTINTSIQRISQLVSQMSPRPTASPRENPENLERLGYGAKSFSLSVDTASRNLGPELSDNNLEEKRKELRNSLSMLSGEVQKLSNLAFALRADIR